MAMKSMKASEQDKMFQSDSDKVLDQRYLLSECPLLPKGNA